MKKDLKNKPIDEKTRLETLLQQFSKLQVGSRDKIEKCNELLSRRSSKSWDAKKKTQIENRLQQAQLEYMQSFEIIDQIKQRLSQL
jgi:Rps23 Pro-64 3,4-dihydroxylase Tpa1-like proline 4-hydroxylase